MSNSVDFSTKLSADPVNFSTEKKKNINFNTNPTCPGLQTVYEEIGNIKTQLNKANEDLKVVLTKVEDVQYIVEILNSDADTIGSVDNKIREAIEWKTL